ncbi:hypothetical protein J6590_084120 [Homalodisca vitripennis]|nr:hypothetical protein J6590_084120 [Homalodisca vitripennis]
MLEQIDRRRLTVHRSVSRLPTRVSRTRHNISQHVILTPGKEYLREEVVDESATHVTKSWIAGSGLNWRWSFVARWRTIGGHHPLNKTSSR